MVLAHVYGVNSCYGVGRESHQKNSFFMAILMVLAWFFVYFVTVDNSVVGHTGWVAKAQKSKVKEAKGGPVVPQPRAPDL